MSYDNQPPAQFTQKRPSVGGHQDMYTGLHIDIRALETLISMVQGKVTLPGDLTYEEERSVWNCAFDGHPAVIVRCLDVDDVKAAVIFAREQRIVNLTRKMKSIAEVSRRKMLIGHGKWGDTYGYAARFAPVTSFHV
ncbi:MAG TPA: hypothetical protein VGN34_32535 [Ktedonobacteraceae bacterium]|jgi:hypothetical protein